MTTLSKKVRREVPHKNLSFVVILHPETPDSAAEIEIRLKHARRGPRATIARIFTYLAREAAGLPAPRGRKARRIG